MPPENVVNIHSIICRIFPPVCAGPRAPVPIPALPPPSPIMRLLADSVLESANEPQAMLRAQAFVKALAAEGEISPALEIVQELQKITPSDRFGLSSELYQMEANLQRQLGNEPAADLALRLAENQINSERLRLDLDRNR